MSDQNGPRKETVRITLPPRRNPSSRETERIGLPPHPAAASQTSKRVLPPPPPPKRTPPPPPGAHARTNGDTHTLPVAPAPPPPSRFAPPVRPPVPPPVADVPKVEVPAQPALPPRVMPPRPRILPPRVIPPSAARAVAAAPENYPGAAGQDGPRKETARITIIPEPRPPTAPTVRMAKTQPLLTVSATSAPEAPVILTAPREPEAEPKASTIDLVPRPICWAIFGISTVTLLIQIWNYVAS